MKQPGSYHSAGRWPPDDGRGADDGVRAEDYTENSHERKVAKFFGYFPPAILAIFSLITLFGVSDKGWRALVVSFMFGYLAVGMGRLNYLNLSSAFLSGFGFKRYFNPAFRFWVATMLAVVIATGLVLWSQARS